MSDYTVMEYLHTNDQIYWLDPTTYQRVGPVTVTGFWQEGLDQDGHPGQGVFVTGAVPKVPAQIILQRTSPSGDTLHFNNGAPV